MRSCSNTPSPYTPPDTPTQAPRPLELLRCSRNLQLYFSSLFITRSGDYISRLAAAWLVYQTTGSAAWLGIYFSIMPLVEMITGNLGGILADRYHHYVKPLLCLLQFTGFGLALLLTLLHTSSALSLWLLLTITAVLGLINSIEKSIRETLYAHLVSGSKKLASTSILSGTILNLSALLAPGIGGWLLGTYGVSTCFLVYTGSFLPLLIILPLLQFETPQAKRIKWIDPEAWCFRDFLADFKAGLTKTYCTPLNLTLVSLQGLAYLLGLGSILVLTPIYALLFFPSIHRTMYGFLMMTFALGSSTALLAYLFTFKGKLTQLATLPHWAFGIMALGYLLITTLHHIPTLFLGIFLLGVAASLTSLAVNALLQALVSPVFRGRVLSLKNMAEQIGKLISALFLGLLIQQSSSHIATLLLTALAFGASVIYWLKLKSTRNQIAAKAAN